MIEIADYLLGTCHSLDDAARVFEVEVEQIEEEISNYGVDRCVGCDWWYEHGELDDETGELLCPDCVD